MKILLLVAPPVLSLPAAVHAHDETAEAGGSRAYVLNADEGEPVLEGQIVIKASPKSGSKRGAMFTQTLAPESRIPRATWCSYRAAPHTSSRTSARRIRSRSSTSSRSRGSTTSFGIWTRA